MSIEDLKAKQVTEQTPAEQSAEPRMSLREAIKHFESQAAKTVPGAPSRAMKQRLFEVPEEARNANPEADFRWSSPSKVQQRLNEGYVVVSAAEGGRRIGDEHILMGIPKALREQHLEANKKLREERLIAHKTEFEGAAERIAKEVRDKHGFKITAEELITRD